MATSYRIIDLRSPIISRGAETIVEWEGPPEEAAGEVLGLVLNRVGRRDDLVARVYWRVHGCPTKMVRLYRKAEPAPKVAPAEIDESKVITSLRRWWRNWNNDQDDV